MGCWDIMSAHSVERGGPPAGVSSFTKIRLKWIHPDQVVMVNPGETRYAFLHPLSEGGDSLAIKIPLEGGLYYLVENRQRTGADSILPDSGILVLKVNPDAVEGTGTVKVMDADPSSKYFTHATYRLDRSNRKLFLDRANNVGVIPLWPGKDKQGVLVTSAEKGQQALHAVMMVQKMWRKGQRGQPMDRCMEAFKRFHFKRCSTIARQALGGK
jgi:hypothetical protein